MDENYLIYTSYLDNGDFALRLFCVNPAENLQQCINQGRSAVFFSATLLPVQYYKKMFSTNTDDYAIYVESPFDPRSGVWRSEARSARSISGETAQSLRRSPLI